MKYNGIKFDRIQGKGEGHEVAKVAEIAILKLYLLRHFTKYLFVLGSVS